jgi:predicted nicotinamide N-methyase
VLLDYRKKRIQESFSGVTLELECLENLDRTIDDVFAWLERTGTPELLEELCPYFGVIWPSARTLAQYITERGDEFKDASVLELGCGLAVPSLVAAKLGAHVSATDYHPEVPRFLKRNLELNRISELRFAALNWQRPPLESSAQAQILQEKYDWVIGSDILYERSHPAQVARAIASYSAPGGRIVVTDPARPYLQAFVDEMKALGYRENSWVENEIFIVEFFTERKKPQP